MLEGIRLHDKVDRGMRGESVVAVYLSFNGLMQSLRHGLSQVLACRRFAILLESGTEGLFVSHVTPGLTRSHTLEVKLQQGWTGRRTSFTVLL